MDIKVLKQRGSDTFYTAQLYTNNTSEYQSGIETDSWSTFEKYLKGVIEKDAAGHIEIESIGKHHLFHRLEKSEREWEITEDEYDRGVEQTE